MADLFMGTMAVINLIDIFLLGKVAFKTVDDYTEQRKGDSTLYSKQVRFRD
jgi:AGCS family alanine or glycine:cation symporter